MTEKSANRTRYVNIYLPYFKQGDDFHCSQEGTKSPIEAFRNHANQMGIVKQRLHAVADFLDEYSDRMDEIKVNGDTHSIMMEAPADIADEMVRRELGDIDEFMEEEDEEEGCDEQEGCD